MVITHGNFIYRALVASSAVGWLVTCVVGSAAIFNESSASETGAGSAAAQIRVPQQQVAPLVTTVADVPGGFDSGYVMQGRDGGVVALGPDAAWSRQDVLGGGLNSPGRRRESRLVSVPLAERIVAGLDSPLVVRAKGLDLAAREARPASVSLSGLLPKLAAAIFCAWLGLYFLRCLDPYNGFPKQRTPRGFFRKGR